jgi:hypothetical protein
MAQFAASLAHEMVHAYHRMTRSTPDPTLPRHARANAFIEEEIATREKEKTIPKEILAPGKRKPLETPDKKSEERRIERTEYEANRDQSTFARASGTRFCFRNKRNVSRNVCYRGSDRTKPSAKTSTTRRSRKART